jgi:hypothetical protein
MAGLIFVALLIGWFFVARWVAKLLTQRIGNTALRRVSMVTIIVVMFILPVADEIIGGFQFRALCSEHAVLKIDAQKIKGRTVRTVSEPENGTYTIGTAVRIYYYRMSYRDIETNEELASYSRYVAKGGWLIKLLSGSNAMTPLTFYDTCTPENIGNLSKDYSFTKKSSSN